jgi:phosphohistidine phosphatase SixA
MHQRRVAKLLNGTRQQPERERGVGRLPREELEQPREGGERQEHEPESDDEVLVAAEGHEWGTARASRESSSTSRSQQLDGGTNQARARALRYREAMRILLVRHGEAVPYDTTPVDERRWLTPAGRAGVRDVAQALAKRGVRLAHVYTSPLVRAVQTAEILVQHVHPACDVPVSVHSGALGRRRQHGAGAGSAQHHGGERHHRAGHAHAPRRAGLAAYLTGAPRFEPFATGAAYMLVRGPSGLCEVEFVVTPDRL